MVQLVAKKRPQVQNSSTTKQQKITMLMIPANPGRILNVTLISSYQHWLHLGNITCEAL
jgi:hypothetical protein